MMLVQPLQSKLIDSVSYDEGNGLLVLRLANGQRREYVGVPRFVFDDLLVTKSPGSYYTKIIKPQFALAERHAHSDQAPLPQG